MSNIQKLATEGKKNHRIFVDIIVDLMNSQGLYSRLYRAVNELDNEGYENLYEQLAQQNFTDSPDVIFWLEC